MLFPLFALMTLLEIYILVSVGDAIGAFSTVLLVIITALIGSTLLKYQGWATMQRAQTALAQGQTPAFEMMEGVVILISGILLITPGFITDALGLAGLVPFSRHYFIRYLQNKQRANGFSNSQFVFRSHQSGQTNAQNPARRPKKPDTIEGEFWENEQ